MADDPATTTRRLSPDDAEAAEALARAAGRPETAADWRFRLARGEGLGRFDRESRLRAAAVALDWTPVAWICGVPGRGGGLDRGLVAALAAERAAAGHIVALDVAPAERGPFAALGFAALYGLVRLRAETAVGPGRSRSPARLAAAGAADAAELAAYDAYTFGGSRCALLEAWLAEGAGRLWIARVGQWVAGYVAVVAEGPVSRLGPLIAEDADIAADLATAALTGAAGPFTADVPDAQAGFRAWLAGRGFSETGASVRMVYDGKAAFDQTANVFCTAGPAFG